MFIEVQLSEIESDGFLHSRITGVDLNLQKNSFIIKMHAVDLKNDKYITTCTITITGWWELEVIEKGKNVYKKYLTDEIPTDIDHIIRYEYDGNILIFKTCGYLDFDSVIDYKFTRPNINITGEYDPD